LTLLSCATGSQQKGLNETSIFSKAMGRNMPYSIYTPPSWEVSENLPLMLLLHGARDKHSSFNQYRVNDYLDSLYHDNKLPRVIIVIPEGGFGFWENWADGSNNYRDWVINDLLPFAQSRYNTRTCPEGCYITGVSMGAHGAMRFAYHEPELFSSIAAISALILSRENAQPTIWQKVMMLFIPIKRIWGDINTEPSEERRKLDPFNSWISNDTLKNTRLYLSWGNRDKKSIIKTNEKFQHHLEKNGRKHEFEVYEGKHLWIDWKEPIAKSIRFHTQTN